MINAANYYGISVSCHCQLFHSSQNLRLRLIEWSLISSFTQVGSSFAHKYQSRVKAAVVINTANCYGISESFVTASFFSLVKYLRVRLLGYS